MKNRILLVFIVLIIAINQALSQKIFLNPEISKPIDSAMSYVYNFQFDSAVKMTKYLEKSGVDPIGLLLYQNQLLYWKNFPLITGTSISNTFESNMWKIIETSNTQNPPKNLKVEYQFYNLMGHLLLMQYFADNGLSGKVVPHVIPGYKMLMDCYDYTEKYPDFSFPIGLYNYYTESYAQSFPVYRPLLFFLKKGNKKEGLRQLQLAADNAIFLKAEARAFLHYIYFNFEKKPEKSLIYAKILTNAYPNNWYYLTLVIRNLLYMTEYDEAEILMAKLEKMSKNEYSKLQLNFFQGLVYEKKYKDWEKAYRHYLKVEDLSLKFNNFSSDYLSYAYYGLSRYYKYANNNKMSKSYHEMAEDRTAYKHLTFNNDK